MRLWRYRWRINECERMQGIHTEEHVPRNLELAASYSEVGYAFESTEFDPRRRVHNLNLEDTVVSPSMIKQRNPRHLPFCVPFEMLSRPLNSFIATPFRIPKMTCSM
jgi:hypothetical protein